MSDAPENATASSGEESGKFRFFSLDMTVGEAMGVHPRVREVFAAFHLGGCAHCAINQYETVGQVCAGYGVDPDMLLEVLEGLMDQKE
ncbi:MAG TPA: disulfide oxidoreductase [Candidatus Hydrogenedentes bacterium]|nr:disulfide oxidoreductase [Candidatus Hydrogenedentota bacterium]HOS04110.1 disulfide oxidoreductase [Candidatus Hydrogenedentota bacterium]